MKTILFIDSENFFKKMKVIINSSDFNLSKYNFKGLFDKVLKDLKIDEIIFYFARLKIHPETKEKSKKLVENQRLLKNNLEKQGIKVVFAGSVRGYKEKINGKELLVFKEKGVDVKIAVDLIFLACKNKLKTAIIGSSDSDLQPAIKVLNELNIRNIYLGFENNSNKGLTHTTNKTILIRNSEIMEFIDF
jgi:uncharacterized LabA/DUF88 family protein